MAILKLKDKNGKWIGIEALRGPQGEPGPRGEPGSAGYTPKKGIDYFTEDERSEFISEIFEQVNDSVVSTHNADMTAHADIRELIEQLAIQNKTINPLSDKTIAVLGDSISSVAYTVPNYWQMIAEKTGCKFLDYGVSGSCFAVRSSEHTPSLLERAGDMADADAVLVMGGTNDAGKDILLGEWNSTDNTTLYGALNALIALLRTKYVGKPIIFCTPIKRKYDTDTGFPKTAADISNEPADTNLELWHCALAIQAKCAAHGIPVIDLYNGSGIGSGRSEFFRTDDDLHPSALGECRIANMVQPILEQQLLHTIDTVVVPGNLVTTSIDTDGTIYNGKGYKDGFRLSSGDLKECNTCTVTGFIPFNTSNLLCIKGVGMQPIYFGDEYCNAYICLYNSSFERIGSTSNGGFIGICTETIDAYKTGENDGVITYDFANIDGAGVAYVRISSPFGEAGSGAGIIVTIK